MTSPLEQSIEREDYEADILTICNRVNSCILITTTSEKKFYSLASDFQSTLCHREVFRDDINQFASLKPQLDLEEGNIFMSNQLMLTFCPPSRRYFYATNCHVCHSSDNFITCEFCRMIFYCSDGHQQDDYYGHVDLCEILATMMEEGDIMSLYTPFKGVDSKTWMQAKFDLMLKAELKLGRKLMDFEEELFLFPKACFVCHDTDLDVLDDCECGVCFCEEHKNDPKHREMCKDYLLAYRVSTTKQMIIIPAIVKVMKKGEKIALSPSLEAFMDKYMLIGNKNSDLNVPNYEKVMMSEFLTRPLTLLHAVRKMNFKFKPRTIIHVIGATTFEVWTQKYWNILMFLVRELRNLVLVFVGPEIAEFSCTDVELTYADMSWAESKRLTVCCAPIPYEDYCRQTCFLTPDFVVGFNLAIHEIEYGISRDKWSEMLLAVESVGAPFILTAGTKERAENDHRIMGLITGKYYEYSYLKLNPFAGLIPYRDYETEGLRYSNKYVIVYSQFCDSLTQKTEDK